MDQSNERKRKQARQIVGVRTGGKTGIDEKSRI